MTPEAAAKLREPFPDKAVGKLPKLTCKQCSDAHTKVCGQHHKVNCKHCGNYISERHIDLDYVGHATTTDRLLTVDPTWTWEPVAVDAQGSPALDREGNLWIRLTVCGVTRLGCGDGKSMKERIGDALRNAAMRFGVALDLWSKAELESHVEETGTGGGSDPRTDVDTAGPVHAAAPARPCPLCGFDLTNQPLKKGPEGYVHKHCPDRTGGEALSPVPPPAGEGGDPEPSPSGHEDAALADPHDESEAGEFERQYRTPPEGSGPQRAREALKGRAG